MAPESLASLARTPGDVALVAFHVCLATLMTASNLALIVTLLSARTLLRKNNYIYTFSIALSDLLVGAGWFYNGLYNVHEGPGLAYYAETLFPMFHGTSLLTLLAAMVDRYYAVQSPFRYAQKMTNLKVVIIISVAWLYPILTNVGMSMNPGGGSLTYNGYTTMIFNILILAVMLVLNVRLYVVTRRQARRTPSSNDRSANVMIVASGLFILLWSPNMVHSSICKAFGACLRFANNASNPFITTRMVNTLVTPMVFLMGSPATRAAFKELTHRLGRKR
ncbi:unnamed protein product [Lampetra planeri]